MAETIRLIGDTQRDFAMRCIKGAPDGHVVKIAAETRRDAQNRKLWPMIEDIRQQVPDMESFAPDDAKLRFMNALGQEMRFLPTLANDGMFPVGQRSSIITVAQFSGLIEIINIYAAEHDVRWSENSQ